MIRKVILLLALFGIGVCSAQDVHYYKLTRIQQDGTPNRNVSGGQFITFSGSLCFESNSKGLSVGNGSLKKNVSYSNSQYTVYQGSSYWGSSTTFKFNADKSVLNVVLDNGDIYVYKRATPPKGVTTCSLIRKKKTPVPPQPNPPQPYPPQPIPPKPDPPQPSPNPSPRYVERTHTCTYCHGKGTITDCDSSIPDFSGNGKYCSECGRHVPMCHIHKRCPSCGGKGTYTKMERAN